MNTQQPKWKLVAQLGDAHPIEYGGYFVFEDEAKVYAPEGEVLTPPTDEELERYTSGTQLTEPIWEIRRFILQPCTFINGILSDNPYHPAHPAWFADKIGAVSNFVDIPTATLVDMFVNGNTVNKALAWQSIGNYFGFDNLDSYPLHLTRAEVETRHAAHPKLVAK